MRSNDVLIKVENVSKKFCRSLKRSLWYGVRDLGRELCARKGNKTFLRKDEFWAARNVSFDVKRGEMLGLIGQNGAGKSTLLKLLNGLIKPDSGRITIKGNLQALIELGAGFNPILSGRENIYINAAVLGISKAQVVKELPGIIEFSGLEEFIDSPVIKYSTGMKSRLGFAIITRLDPDILLIDEVLAVGDIAFQEKCMRRMDKLRHENKAIIFVTHSLYQVEALCNKALWLEHGEIVQYGDAGEVVRAFLDQQEIKSMKEAQKEGNIYEGRITEATKAYFKVKDDITNKDSIQKPDIYSELIKILKVELLDESDNVRNELPFGSDLTVKIHYHAIQRIKHPLFNLRFLCKGKAIFETSMLIDGHGPDFVEGSGIVECRIPNLPLTPKVYDILLFVRSAEGIADITTMRTVAQFRITDENLDKIPMQGPMALNHLRQGSPVYLTHTWKFYNKHEHVGFLDSRYLDKN